MRQKHPQSVGEIGVSLRIGMHSGECDVVADKLRGIGVHVGARVASRAGPGEIFVSQTVRDLVAGSGDRVPGSGLARAEGSPRRLAAVLGRLIGGPPRVPAANPQARSMPLLSAPQRSGVDRRTCSLVPRRVILVRWGGQLHGERAYLFYAATGHRVPCGALSIFRSRSAQNRPSNGVTRRPTHSLPDRPDDHRRDGPVAGAPFRTRL